MARKILTKSFSNMSEYLDWVAIQSIDDGIRVVGLREADEDNMVAEYIELF